MQHDTISLTKLGTVLFCFLGVSAENIKIQVSGGGHYFTRISLANWVMDIITLGFDRNNEYHATIIEQVCRRTNAYLAGINPLENETHVLNAVKCLQYISGHLDTLYYEPNESQITMIDIIGKELKRGNTDNYDTLIDIISTIRETQTATVKADKRLREFVKV